MRHFFLYTSNRLEHLALVLARVTAEPLDPMRPETILVQSAGMQRWVSMQLAREHGVWANARFPFPVAFAYDLARTLLPGLPEEYPLSQERMLWRVASLLPGLADRPEFAPVRRYLDSADTLKLIQLARKIAFHFDQYLIFRPRWAALWESGRTCGETHGDPGAEAWQAVLWRETAKGREQEHRAALLRRVMEALRQKPAVLPPRLSVFGISTLPPAYLDLLLALAEHVPVHMFLLSPSRQYWGDLPGQRERLREYRLLTEHGVPPQEEVENPLAGLGALGRDFHDLLVAGGVEEMQLYRDFSASRTLLEHVQQDLLELSPVPDSLPDLDGESIQVHCCHSPMREMETLQDIILDRLQRDETLTPRDILIMAPDMDLYAPFIQAVFGAPEDPSRFLPFSMADRRPSQTQTHARLLLELLEFGLSRFEATAVLDLLEAPAIRQALQLDETDVSRIREWVDEARIRWGADPDFQSQTGGVLYPQNTWEQGLARLFLGYMTGPGGLPVRGVSPLGPLGGDDQELLGRLAAFLDQLRQMRDFLSIPAGAGEWRQRLLWMLDTFFPRDRDTADALCGLRQSVTALVQAMSVGAPEIIVDSRAMLHLLRERLDAASAEGGFLSSGLTFCGLRPMRAIPFRVICLAGLSSTGFPRQDTRPGFDLMAASPRPGDRSLRDDDRYLFLESLISARDALILTYPGLSPRDNSESPPSVLVSELLDYLDSRARVSGRLPSEALVTRHRLQGFHPDYFRSGSPLFSFSEQNCRGARALCGQPVSRPFFPADAFPEGCPASCPEISLGELEDFLSHPVRCLLRALGVRPVTPDGEIPDEEPLAVPDGLDGFGLNQDLLNFMLAGNPPESAVRERLRAGQGLPPGPAGQEAIREMYAQVSDQAARIRMEQAGEKPVFHDLALDLGTCRITARLPLLADGAGWRMVAFRATKLKGADMLRLWVRHLAAGAAGLSVASVHVAGGDIFTAPAVSQEQAAQILRDLVRLRMSGMSAPLPFFPRASLAYAHRRFDTKNSDMESALNAAWKDWLGGYSTRAEREDPFLRVVYRDAEPDWEAFAAVTEAVYGPLLGGDRDL